MECGGRTPLHAAALGGSEGVVSSLLRAGAQPGVNVASTSSTRSALYVAEKCGHEDAARRLLLEGADPNFEDLIDKGTALHEAADSGHEQLVRDLLAAGACPNARRGGQECYMPLHLAASRGPLGTLSTLLTFGADKDALDDRGALLIHHAISRDHVAATGRLLAAGADQTAGGGPFFWPRPGETQNREGVLHARSGRQLSRQRCGLDSSPRRRLFHFFGREGGDSGDSPRSLSLTTGQK